MNRHKLTGRRLVTILATLILTAPAFAQEVSGKETQTARTFWGLAAENLEYRYSDTDEELAYIEGDAFYGTDELKLRWLVEAEWEKAHSAWETLENQLVVQTPVSEFWDAKAGLRIDTPKGQNRRYGVLGLTGLAPQWLEVDTSLFVSDKGDASMDFEVEYELLVTNYWIASASFETRIALHEDRETGVGEGLNYTETGLRLSYDLAYRSFSPYVGVVHERQYRTTADMTEAEGGDVENWFAVVGARIMF